MLYIYKYVTFNSNFSGKDYYFLKKIKKLQVLILIHFQFVVHVQLRLLIMKVCAKTMSSSPILKSKQILGLLSQDCLRE